MDAGLDGWFAVVADDAAFDVVMFAVVVVDDAVLVVAGGATVVIFSDMDTLKYEQISGVFNLNM